MKRIFKILPGLLCGLAACPIALSATSCSNNTMSLDFKYLDYANINSGTTWGDLKSPDCSLEQMLYGDKNINDGNYVFLLGSMSGKDSPNNSLAEQYIFDRNEQWGTFDVEGMHVSNSGLQEIYDKTVTGDEYSKYPNGIAFLTLLDIDPNKQGAVDDVWATWSKTDEEADSSHKEGEYKRTDQGAKNYRDCVGAIRILFSNFGDDNLPSNQSGTNEAYFIIWKDGKPMGWSRDTNAGTNPKILIDKMHDIYIDDKTK